MLRTLIVFAVVLPLTTLARPADVNQDYPDPLVSELKVHVGSVTRNVLAAAELMPATEYGWKPIGTVRSFSEIIGHITDTSRYFCGTMAGKTAPFSPERERASSNKAEAIATLKSTFERCDAVVGAITDDMLDSRVQIAGGQLIDGRDLPAVSLTKGFLVALHASHTNEHYGNLVTYLRLKGIVPPSSQR